MGSVSTERTDVDPRISTASELFRRVLVPIDYSLDSHRALGVALELMRTHGAAVGLFHAEESSGSDEWLGGIGSPSVGGDWIAHARARLRRFVENVAPWALDRVELLASVGDPRTGLRRVAESFRPTLVVVAADVAGGFFRSPAERLVHGSEVPMLVIPSSEDTEDTAVRRTAPAKSAAGSTLARPPRMTQHDDRDRKPGRSFDDPSRPLGEDTLRRGHEVGANLEDGVYGRAETEAKDTGVADRAKVIAVLRKAEEFMATSNPSEPRRALELAAGRIGLKFEEYQAIVKSDDELMDLERKVLAAHGA